MASTVTAGEISSFVALQKTLNGNDSVETMKKYNLPLMLLFLHQSHRLTLNSFGEVVRATLEHA